MAEPRENQASVPAATASAGSTRSAGSTGSAGGTASASDGADAGDTADAADAEGADDVRGPLTVAAVARRLGVAPSTLRTWDRRYGLGPRGHSSGSHRRYAPEDLDLLVTMRRLTLDGVAPAEAARIAKERAGAAPPTQPASDPSPPDPSPPGPFPPGPFLAGPSPVDPLPLGLSLPESSEPGPSGRAGLSSVDGARRNAARRGLRLAATSLDVVEMARLVRTCLHAQGLEVMWHELVLPVLNHFSERWESHGDGVESEHALSQVVTAVLHAEKRPVPRPVNSSPVLLACAESDHHMLALDVLDHALADRGVQARLLGLGMPRRALVTAVRRSGPAAVFLFASMPARDQMLLAELPRQRPAPRIVVGGPGWASSGHPPGVRRVESLDSAIDEIMSALHL